MTHDMYYEHAFFLSSKPNLNVISVTIIKCVLKLEISDSILYK